MKRQLYILGIFLCILIACTHDAILPVKSNGGLTGGKNPGGGVVVPNDSVCFQTDVLPLFQTYCASPGCHDATTAAEDLNLTTYNNIIQGISSKNTNSSRYYQVIQDGSMPPRSSPQLSATQVKVIAKWINEGALNKICSVAACDSTKNTYANGVSQIFSTYCNGCHGVAPGSGNVVLSDYASAKAAGTAMKASFLSAINYTSTSSAMNMPQSGKLSSCQISQISTWITNGCPQ